MLTAVNKNLKSSLLLTAALVVKLTNSCPRRIPKILVFNDLSDCYWIFKFDTQLYEIALNNIMAQQQLNVMKITRFIINLSNLCPLKLICTIVVHFKSD